MRLRADVLREQDVDVLGKAEAVPLLLDRAAVRARHDGHVGRCVRGGKAAWRVSRGETFAVATAPLEAGRPVLFAFAYDDICSIEYFGKRLPAYWKKDGKTVEEAIAEAYEEYPALRRREQQFSGELQQKARQAGGEQRGARPYGGGQRPMGFVRQAPKEPTDFEDRLKQFMQSSDSKLSELRYIEKKGGNRRGGGGRRG